MKSHRQTIKADIELLQKCEMEIQKVNLKQNRYNLLDRTFDVVELKLLIDEGVSSKFITKNKSEKLAAKLSTLLVRIKVLS